MNNYNLYSVEVTFKTVIRAKSEVEAINLAPSLVKQEDDPPQDVYASEIHNLNDLPDGWTSRCLPWGERHPDDLSIEEQLKTQNGQ